jgi:hypothetical protein
MTGAQGARKINDPIFIRNAPNDTPQLGIVFDWVYNTKPLLCLQVRYFLDCVRASGFCWSEHAM